MIKVIKKEKDLEMLFTLRELAKGTSNTILYQLPAAFQSKMSEILGGNAPGDVFRMLSEENQQYLKEVIEESIRKLSQTSGGKK